MIKPLFLAMILDLGAIEMLFIQNGQELSNHTSEMPPIYPGWGFMF
jgi:hypothetical protein